MTSDTNFQGPLSRLAAEAVDFAHGDIRHFYNTTLAACSLTGDADALREYAKYVASSLESGEPLNAAQRYWLHSIMLKIGVTNVAVAVANGGIASKGAPRKQSKQKHTALLVFKAIFDVKATSLEDAWQVVADQSNQSFSNVKAAWTKEKQFVFNMLECSSEVDDGAALLAKILAISRSDRKVPD